MVKWSLAWMVGVTLFALTMALGLCLGGDNETSNRDSSPHATADRVGGDETPEARVRPVAGEAVEGVDRAPLEGSEPGEADGDEAPAGRDIRHRRDTGGGAAGVPEGAGVEARGRGSDTSATTRQGGGSVSEMRGRPSSIWLQGYRAHGGNPAWERRFLETVIPCEGREFNWDWRWGDSFYLSVLQFNPGTWETASQHTGHSNPEDLSHVGANAAYWSNRVDPASTAGWADCW